MQLTEKVHLIGSGEIGLSNSYDCHVYLVDGGDDAVIIDSGVGIEPERLKQNVEKVMDWNKVSRIICTHSHADHGGGSQFFQQEGKEVWLSDVENEWMQNNRDEVELALELAINAGGYPQGYQFKYFQPDYLMKEEEAVKCGSLTLQPIHVKGHSPGMFCFYMETKDKNVLFSGDTVFVNGEIGLLNAPGSSLHDFREDMGKLADLKTDALFPGHRLFVLSNGQEHVQMGIDQMSKVFTPRTF